MRFAVGLPNVKDYADPKLLVELAARAEAAEWDGVFLWDHLLYRRASDGVTDPWIALAAIAHAKTPRSASVPTSWMKRWRS
jgi:alkanesulfonate monooxygenase SsuD/methylene tetrahydromethanopterin reductase-like flavin-dependent oxidoreductase (luciferase family)